LHEEINQLKASYEKKIADHLKEHENYKFRLESNGHEHSSECERLKIQHDDQCQEITKKHKEEYEQFINQSNIETRELKESHARTVKQL